jgi:hypothetical protein
MMRRRVKMRTQISIDVAPSMDWNGASSVRHPVPFENDRAKAVCPEEHASDRNSRGDPPNAVARPAGEIELSGRRKCPSAFRQ